MASELEVGGLQVADGGNDVAVNLGNSSYGMALDYSSGDLSLKTNTVNRLTVSNTGLAEFTSGIKNERGIYGGQITIADDAVGTITPPRQGVMMAISYNNDQAYPTHQTYVGIVWCDTGSSQYTAKLTSEGGGISVHSAVDLSAGGETDSVDERINISTVAGTIQLKNRIGSSATWWYNFIA